MKRIKYEEIQNSIQNYVKQRNLSTSLVQTNLINEAEAKKNKSSVTQQIFLKKQLMASAMNNQSMDASLSDFNLTALNDLVLIESSINDYYSYSFNSSSEQDYLKQFQIITNFITDKKEVNDELDQFLFPLFIYMCIDLTYISCSIPDIISNFANQLENLNQKDQELIENLVLFNETKDLNKCKLVNKFLKNKYQIRIRSSGWQKFLSFLRTSKTHLFLRTINVHLQILINDHTEPESDTVDYIVKKETLETDIEIESKKATVKLENSDYETDSSGQTNSSSESFISLKSLEECIDNIKSQPSRINGACCYYISDPQDCITSASISPNCNFVSFTNENSSIFLYKLNDQRILNHSLLEESDLLRENPTNNSYQELAGGHSNVVFKSKFTHDSKYLLSCGADNVACLWDVNKPEASHVCTYSGHLYPVWDLEIFSKLNLFATASKDGTSRLWSFDHIYPLRIYCGHQSDINCVRFHPNGSYLASGSSDKTVRLWSVQTGDFVRLFSGHRSRVFTVAFSPDGNYLASGGEDKKIKLWDLRSGLLFKEFKGHSDIVHALWFDNNSEILCSGGLDRSVKFWDVHRKNIKIGPDISETNNTETSKNQKNSCNLNHSSELIKSISVDFNVYSIYCDEQNVFYLNGAKKPPKIEHLNTSNLKLNDTKASDLTNQQKKSGLKLEKIYKTEKKTYTSISNSSLHKSSTVSGSSINTRRRAAQAAAASTNNTNNNQYINSNSNSRSNSSYLFSNNDDLYEA